MYPSPACLIRSAWCSDPWHLPLVFAGHRSALWHGHRRVEPSQSTPGRVRCPPARSQPPLQGRAAEGVERAGPSSPRHLSSAEGPTHINPPTETSRFGHEGILNRGPTLHLHHKEALIQKPRPHIRQCPLMGKLAPPALCHLPSVWGIILLTLVQTPFLLFPFVIPRIRSKAVLSVGLVLLSHYITVMQVKQHYNLEHHLTGNTSAVLHWPAPFPFNHWMFCDPRERSVKCLVLNRCC